MDRKYINDMLNAGPCPGGMEETIIAFASGELESEEKRMQALIHILICDSCRFTYEDYLRMEHDEDNTYDLNIPEISFNIVNDFIVPFTEHTMQSVAVLSTGKLRTVEFNVTSDKLDYKIVTQHTKEGTELAVECDDDNAKFYLVDSKSYKTSFPYSGRASFAGLKTGKYILSKNMKHFVFIDIK